MSTLKMFLWTNKNINNIWLKKCLIWGYAILLEFGMEFLSGKHAEKGIESDQRIHQ